MLWNKLGATLANSGQVGMAMDAYYAALEMNPQYIRARYNSSVACLNMGLYKEAAEHLIGGLEIQQEQSSLLGMSLSGDSLWRTLSLACSQFLGDKVYDVLKERDLEKLKNMIEIES